MRVALAFDTLDKKNKHLSHRVFIEMPARLIDGDRIDLFLLLREHSDLTDETKEILQDNEENYLPVIDSVSWSKDDDGIYQYAIVTLSP